MTRFALLLAAAVATFAPAAIAPVAHAQTLRSDLVVVEGDLVRLSDLFDGVNSDRAVLRAPAPGRRVAVEIAQLMEITRFDRVLVERMGRTVESADIVPVLRQALVAEGMRASDEIDFGGRAPSLSLPFETPADLEIRQLQFDRANGRFTATLIAGGNHAGAQRLTLQGRVTATARLPVLRRAIGAGETIRAADVEMAQVREDATRRDVIASADKLIGQVARQRLREREPVRETDVRQATLVARNANVTVLLQTGNLSLSVQGRAIEEGARGDTIRVFNSASNRQIEGVVVGPDTVAVQMAPRIAALKP
jgi:flagella basal body P-ring formation protein FlgA